MKPKISTTVFDLDYYFSLSPDLICVSGYDGYFKKINPSVSKTLGYTFNELMSAPINSFIHPDDRERSAEKSEKLIKGEGVKRFENRYLTKNGAVIWLSWTSIPVERDKVIFSIAKDITYQLQIDDYQSTQSLLDKLDGEQKHRFGNVLNQTRAVSEEPTHLPKLNIEIKKLTIADREWLTKFEALVKKEAGSRELNLNVISQVMAMSERQLFRQIKGMLGTTPNKLVRIIRLQLAWEAITTGKYKTISQIATIAGFSSRAHFKKLFFEMYGIDVAELL